MSNMDETLIFSQICVLNFCLSYNFVYFSQIFDIFTSQEVMFSSTVNDLFSAQCTKERLFWFNIGWRKIPLLAHPS